MTTFWLIRHGESQSNAGLRTLLPATVELTPAGWQQAQQVADAFTQAPALIVTSSYLRSQQMAKPLAARFPDVPVVEWPVHEFTFLALGRCMNMTDRERRPMVNAYWNEADPFHCDGEGAESFATFCDRIRGFLVQVQKAGTGLVAVFTHGDFIKCLLWSTFAGPMEMNTATMRQFYHYRLAFLVPNGAIIKASFDGTGLWQSGLSVSHLGYREI